MPSDDLVINVKQIASYGQVSAALPTDVMLLQRSGLGGPYVSITPQAFAATAMIVPTVGLPLQVGYPAPVDALGAQIFALSFAAPLDGQWLWNAYWSSAGGFRNTVAGPSASFAFDPAAGWQFLASPPVGAGSSLALTGALTISPTGYVTQAPLQSIMLGRDPYLPHEAATMFFVTTQNQATMEWVNAANQKLIDMMAAQNAAIAAYHCGSVWSVNGRTGDVLVLLSDIEAAFFAGGQPTSPMPPAGDYSYAIATTAWVTWAIANVKGPITVTYAGPTGNHFEANDPTPPGQTGYGAWFGGSRAGVTRWYFGLGDGSPETGGNVGSDFGLWASNDDGSDAFNSVPVLAITRATGASTFSSQVEVSTNNQNLKGQFVADDPTPPAQDGFGAYVMGTRAGVLRWYLALGGGEPETGGNSGSNLGLWASNDDGSDAFGGAAVWYVHRATGLMTFNKSLQFGTLPTNAANDAAAATAGVPVGGIYRNGSALMVRVA